MAAWRWAVASQAPSWAFLGRGLKVARLWKNQRLLRVAGPAAGADARSPERGRPRPQQARSANISAMYGKLARSSSAASKVANEEFCTEANEGNEGGCRKAATFTPRGPACSASRP